MNCNDEICIEVKDVSHVYRSVKRGSVEAIKGISFGAKKKEFVSLVGPSGCGKTTLLKIIGNLIKPTKGEVLVDGEPANVARKKAKFGFVFQNPVLLPWRSALKNTVLFLEILHRRIDETPMKLLELVGLSNFEDCYPRELSGGMQSRVAIARSLAFNPEILLMDEPFGALDEFTREKLGEDLLRIWAETRKTVIFVTHSVPEAAFLSQRVVVLSGRPATVVDIVDIGLPYPRIASKVKASNEYTDYVRKIRNSLGGSLDDSACARIM